MSELIEKLSYIKERYDEVGKQIIDPEIVSDMNRYIKLNKEYKDLSPIVSAYLNYKNVLENIKSSKEIINKETDPDFVQMAKEELNELEEQIETIEEEVKLLLILKQMSLLMKLVKKLN